MASPQIQAFHTYQPTIYAYTIPDYPKLDGWVKIGYTAKQSVAERIKQQGQEIPLEKKFCWQRPAIKDNWEPFTDKEFHRFLEREKQTERIPHKEWFRISPRVAKDCFHEFCADEIITSSEQVEYDLRDEQSEAVEMTYAYFAQGGKEFLWNAKPRFGKTLTCYDLVQRMKCKTVLILTNRPAISNSWLDDFNKFIGWRGEYVFVSDNPSLKGKSHVLTREQYINKPRNPETNAIYRTINFESFQNLKGSRYFGGDIDKLDWITGIEFDLLVIDESQEGVSTEKTEDALRSIRRKHTLYLSGTPFKQLASGRFYENQIFNWTYIDEQKRKENWGLDNEDEFDRSNPYEDLPSLAMYTYQLSPMIREEIQRGCQLENGETVDYAFDLNEFFVTKGDSENLKFVHEKEVKKFLHALVTQTKYPFSTDRLRQELSHTIWLLNRVNSCKALETLLKNDEVFKDYKIVVAAGNEKQDDEEQRKSFDKVREAIKAYDKTITLSVGQLTVGVTIPEWSGILMLCNLHSASSYMQAIFRVQNPHRFNENGVYYRKEQAYVFDFDPARTLTLFDEFADKLQSHSHSSGNGASTRGENTRQENIRQLLNFFPVIGEDSEGEMVELDPIQVLTIPRHIKSEEVVHRGFMSNFLFQNISNIFSAPTIVEEILDKMTPAPEQTPVKGNLSKISEIHVDKNGGVEVPNEIIIGKEQELFDDKVYETFEETIRPELESLQTLADESPNIVEVVESANKIIAIVTDNVLKTFVKPVLDDAESNKELTKGEIKRHTTQIEKEIQQAYAPSKKKFTQEVDLANTEYQEQLKQVETEEEKQSIQDEFDSKIQASLQELTNSVTEQTERIKQEIPRETVERVEKNKSEKEKRSMEDKVREHLRGFSRTIPSFIMAYGDENLELANFDDYTEDDVFREVTGISENEFRFLRDGGTYTDPETGEERYFEGHLFDELVFNDSIQKFWKKSQELADYFDENQEEDIFDYIPPQKTNQIYTPRWVVEQMVDYLEEHNPGCFDDPNKTFADLYMKSGLYITEIVKRLYRSEGLKKAFPDEEERITHILKNQVYGMAPTRIIYLIATKYIFGIHTDLKEESTHFVEADTAEASKNGMLEKLVEEKFG